MENASKALLIAGGILIALIILTTFILMFNKMSTLQEEQEEQIKVEQLAAFNGEFEAFNKKIMYGTDVITLINKAVENNEKYAGNTEYQIIVTLEGETMTSSSHLIGTDAESTIYTCTSIQYNNSGRVCRMDIEMNEI